MPRYSFTQQASSSGDVDRFPRLKLDTGEKARIWMPEEPWMEWMHRIEAPVIDHGETVLEVKDTKNGPIEVMKMDWIGSVFCLGETGTPDNPGPLMTAGIDPDNCPVCEVAAKKTGVSPPAQRFAANIIKYKVRGRGPTPYVLASPVSAEVLIWAYTGRVHGTLYELGSEHGDLRKHDVKLELEDTPAADKWQRMKQIAIIVEPAYKDPRVKEYVTDSWKTHPENRATDEQLRNACQGRDVPRQVLLDMVRRAERQWSQAENAGSGGGDGSQADAGFNGSLSDGIDSLLDASPKDPWVEEERGRGARRHGGVHEPAGEGRCLRGHRGGKGRGPGRIWCHGRPFRGRDPYCDRCNYDRHRCPGCGETAPARNRSLRRLLPPNQIARRRRQWSRPLTTCSGRPGTDRPSLSLPGRRPGSASPRLRSLRSMTLAVSRPWMTKPGEGRPRRLCLSLPR